MISRSTRLVDRPEKFAYVVEAQRLKPAPVSVQALAHRPDSIANRPGFPG
jgi:hypothetical protein